MSDAVRDEGGPVGRRNAQYRERLHVPLRWWVQGNLLVASFWLALVVAVAEAPAWSITAALTVLLAAGLQRYGGARVVVGDGRLRAGRARIELRFVGPAHPLDPVRAREVSGRLADARAFLLLRPYLPEAVRIEINDPDDPTPYWLVSSRRAAALASALNDSAPRQPLPRPSASHDLGSLADLSAPTSQRPVPS